MPVQLRTGPQQSASDFVASFSTGPGGGRYFLNIKEGETLIPDPEGDDLPDESGGYSEIRATVDEVLNLPHVYGDLRRWVQREFVLTDERGRTVMTVPVSAFLRPNRPS